MTCNDLLQSGIKKLEDKNIPDAAFDARELLLFVLGIDFTGFCMRRTEEAPAFAAERYGDCIARRAAGEPLQYIIGKWDFFRSSFYVGSGVLIPRPETEELVSYCIDIIKRRGFSTVFDLCTGSGCIAISIAQACPDTQVFAFELYPEALCYAKKNINAHGISNIELIECDISKGAPCGLPAPQLIVSNPPYIESAALCTLQRELNFEPQSALDGGADGLKFYRDISDKWLPLISENGAAAVECGEGQSERIAELFSAELSCRTVRDMYGAERFVLGEK